MAVLARAARLIAHLAFRRRALARRRLRRRGRRARLRLPHPLEALGLDLVGALLLLPPELFFAPLPLRRLLLSRLLLVLQPLRRRQRLRLALQTRAALRLHPVGRRLLLPPQVLLLRLPLLLLLLHAVLDVRLQVDGLPRRRRWRWHQRRLEEGGRRRRRCHRHAAAE